MKTTTVQEVYDLLDRIAPFALAEAWDNVGILAGRRDAQVTNILVALDVNRAVIKEAAAHSANLIVTHHPILFNGRKNLLEDDAEAMILCELVRSRLSLISAHTNLDEAPGGVNDALATALNLSEVTGLEKGLRLGTFEGGFSAFKKTAECLGGALRVRGQTDKERLKVCVCGGAGGNFWEIASCASADVYLTGEIKHFDALCAVEAGLVIVEAGHEETERVAMAALSSGLQMALNEVQCNAVVFTSALSAFSIAHSQ